MNRSFLLFVTALSVTANAEPRKKDEYPKPVKEGTYISTGANRRATVYFPDKLPACPAISSRVFSSYEKVVIVYKRGRVWVGGDEWIIEDRQRTLHARRPEPQLGLTVRLWLDVQKAGVQGILLVTTQDTDRSWTCVDARALDLAPP